MASRSRGPRASTVPPPRRAPRDPPSLDDMDRRILAVLAEDGRATLQAIAEKVGLRRPSVHERVRRLERDGVVRGYRADLDPEALEAGMVAFLLLRIDMPGDGTQDCLACCEQVGAALRRIPGVLEFHTTAGSDDALAKVRVRDVRELEEVVMRQVSGVKGVRRVSTLVALRTHFERGLRPRGEA